ncbi:MAG: hypothetical protein WBC22_02335 [Sedimentisphaerales bacterium]
MAGKIILFTIFLSVFIVGETGCVTKQGKGDSMNSEMVNLYIKQDIEKIKGFISADPKDSPSPIPTDLHHENVLAFLRTNMTLLPSAKELDKYCQLAVFYNLKGLEKEFFLILRENEKIKGITRISEISITALLWISPDQLQQIQPLYQNMLGRANFPDDSKVVLQTGRALDSPDAVAGIKNWFRGKSDALDKQIKHLENQPVQGNIEELKGHQRLLNNYVNNEVKELEADIQKRASILSIKEQKQLICSLVNMYMGDNEEQKYWSAIKLIRIAEDNEEIQKQIASQFLNLSQAYSVDELRYEELGKKYEENSEAKLDDIEYARLYGAVLKRERCLYAAEFFKGTLDSTQSTWLKKQDDDGTNLLALRPNWKYPVSGEE